jgi:dolichol-phosphate mannosyltransferase
MSRRILVVIGTYNERENIEPLVKSLLSLQASEQPDILIVDDNSPDGTGKIADALSLQFPRVHVLHGPRKRGLGKACIEAFGWALQKGYEVIITMDADFSHNPRYLPEMIERSKSCDLVIGSRYVRGGGVVNWPWYRRLMSRGGSIYAHRVTGMPVSDATGGFNCYRKSVLESIGMHNIRSEGYAFQIEMKCRAWKRGFNICEIPIVFPDRTSGESKMSKKIFAEAFFRCIQLRFSN